MPEEGEAASGGLTPSQQVQELLDARAGALSDGDVAGYLEPLDPPARELEEPIAAQAADLPLSEIRLRLPDATFEQREVDGEQLMVADNAKVDFVFRYEGIPDDNPFHFRLRSDFERHDGEWRVADSELVIPDEQTPVPIPPMWAHGPVETARSEHFLGLFRPDLPDAERERSLSLAEQVRGQLVPKLDLEVSPSHVMQVVESAEEFEQLVPGDMGTSAAAVTTNFFASSGYSRSPIPQNRLMTLSLERLSTHADISMEEGFQHELGHLVTSRFFRPSTPRWVDEAGAMELSGEQRTGQWRAGLENGVFEDMSFVEVRGLEGEEFTQEHYAYTNAAASYLVDEYGSERFWEFYRNFKEYDVGGSAGTPLENVWADATHRLLVRFYGMDEEELDEHTLEWIREHAAPPGSTVGETVPEMGHAAPEGGH